MNCTVISVELVGDARAAAYQAGYCVDCGLEPHSPGRPRCEQCHRTWVRRIPPGSIDFDDIYSHELCVGPVCRRERKTNRFRVRHDRNDHNDHARPRVCSTWSFTVLGRTGSAAPRAAR